METGPRTSFLAEIDGDHDAWTAAWRPSMQTEGACGAGDQPGLLLCQYADVLMDKTVVYENEKYLYISNDL